MSNAEELAKYKQLLDDRVITQEDFDKKKEQLLNRNESSGLTTDNTWLVALLLCLFVGFLGIHKSDLSDHASEGYFVIRGQISQLFT